MKRLIRLFYILIMIEGSSCAFFEKHMGIKAYKSGDFTKAKECFAELLPDDSTNSELLFNLGDAAYRTENYSQACAYFNAAAENAGMSSTDLILKEQALFNAGNSYVKENELEKALEQYEKILKKNPEHERAAHNKKVVEELLKKQNQEKEKKDQNQDQEEKDDKKDSQDQETDNKEKSQKESGKKEPKGKDQSSNDQEQNNYNQKGDEKKDQQENREQKEQESKEGENNTSKDDPKEKQGQKNQTGQQQQRNSQNDQKQGSTPEQKQSGQQNNIGSNSIQESKNEQEKEGPLQAELVENEEIKEDLKDPVNQLFKYVESEDEQASKRLFKSIINQGMPRNHGQKNW